MRRVSFSKKNIDITDFALHHSDLEESLRNYFSANSGYYPARFTGYSATEVSAELQARLAEVDMASCLTLLSAVEAVFRIDYLQRCYQKERDPLSRAFRDLHKRKRLKVNLEDEIFDLWKQHTNGASQLIGDLKGAFKYRHWLAHGRYWKPRLAKKYDFLSLYALAASVLSNFPLLGP
jgi:hypothetical protein